MIEQVERFRCGKCGYITESKFAIKHIKEDGICPACNNGKGKGQALVYKGG